MENSRKIFEGESLVDKQPHYQRPYNCTCLLYTSIPFEITTQAIERTLVDKVFAICDYYMTEKTERHSRHLYDIYKILEYISPDTSLSKLIQEVRKLREPLSICPSAKQDLSLIHISFKLLQRLTDRRSAHSQFFT